MRDIKWLTILGLVLAAGAVVAAALGNLNGVTLAIVGLTLVFLDK